MLKNLIGRFNHQDYSKDILLLALLMLALTGFLLLERYYWWSLGRYLSSYIFHLAMYGFICLAIVFTLIVSQSIKLALAFKLPKDIVIRSLLLIFSLGFILSIGHLSSPQPHILMNGFTIRLEKDFDFATILQLYKQNAPQPNSKEYIHIERADWPETIQEFRPSHIWIRNSGDQKIMVIEHGGPLHPRWGIAILPDLKRPEIAFDYLTRRFEHIQFYDKGIYLWYGLK